MTDRSDFEEIRTNRPAAEYGRLPTVADVLRTPSLAQGRPEVLAGSNRLDGRVRWVHVVESAGIGKLLSGQELVLSTGVGWPGRDGELAGYVGELLRAGIAGLVLELGPRYSSAPQVLIDICREAGLPLVVLRSQVKFVAVTEEVHRRIIAAQMTALQARDEVHSLFTDLNRTGAPADYVVAEAARLLGVPVVLEDLAHRVVVCAPGPASDGQLLNDWERRSRLEHQHLAAAGTPAGSAQGAAEGWQLTPVEARGQRWGYLAALPGEPHPAGTDMVLEQAAVSLSLGRVAAGGADEWTRLGHQLLLDAMLQRRFSDVAGLQNRLAAAGFSVRGRRLAGLALNLSQDPDGSRTGDIQGDVLRAGRSLGADVLCAHSTTMDTGLLVALSMPRFYDDHAAFLDTFAARVNSQHPDALRTVTAGSLAGDVGGLLDSLGEAMDLMGIVGSGGAGDSGSHGADDAPLVHRSDRQEMTLLLSHLRYEPRVQDYVEKQLGPLLSYDARHNTDLLEVLSAFLKYPGNRTRAAQASHLSRSVFYQRLAVIEKLLARDLTEGETVAGLYAAVVAHRQQ